MRNSRLPFHKRIIFWMVIPVVIVGIIVSGGLIRYLSPPMITYLGQHFETNLKLASKLGLNICEGYFTDLLNMRLEDNQEMNRSMQNQAIEEIKSIAEQLPSIQTIILENDGSILASSAQQPKIDIKGLDPKVDMDSILEITVGDAPAKGHLRYFPFWDWTIVSYVLLQDYQSPIRTATIIVYLSTISVFFAVLITLVLVFYRLVNKPLNRLIVATENVMDGNLEKVARVEPNELGRLTSSFNEMIESLDSEKAEVRHLLDELKQSEGRFRTLFDKTPIGICVSQVDGLILESNLSLQQMIGYSKDELKAQSIKNLLYDQRDVSTLMDLIEAQYEGHVYETKLLKKDESVCEARITITMTILDEQEVVIAMVEDITAQKKLETQLQHSQKMEAVGLLAGGVAHDLNNILSGLVSYPELLLMRMPEDSPLRKPVKTIQTSGIKAAAIVQDLLTLARRGVANKEIINLNDLITEYLMSPEFEKLKGYHPKIEIITAQEQNLANISGSAVHLSKTLMNLVSNAAEAMKELGSIKVETKNVTVERPISGFETILKGKYAVLSVSDTGVGLSEEDMDKIFEPFYTKKKMGRSGTGLGMTVVWGTVKDHDGFIDLKSKVGLGTKISLYLPSTELQAELSDEQKSPKDYSSKGESILIVDDMEEQRELLHEILTELDYNIISAKSGEEAVEILKEKKVDLVILDMIMDPGMDGLETYKAILQIHPKQKAIIASGYSETNRVKIAESLGVGQYIKKPFSMEEIGVAIRKELDY